MEERHVADGLPAHPLDVGPEPVEDVRHDALHVEEARRRAAPLGADGRPGAVQHDADGPALGRPPGPVEAEPLADLERAHPRRAMADVQAERAQQAGERRQRGARPSPRRSGFRIRTGRLPARTLPGTRSLLDGSTKATVTISVRPSATRSARSRRDSTRDGESSPAWSVTDGSVVGTAS